MNKYPRVAFGLMVLLIIVWAGTYLYAPPGAAWQMMKSPEEGIKPLPPCRFCSDQTPDTIFITVAGLGGKLGYGAADFETIAVFRKRTDKPSDGHYFNEEVRWTSDPWDVAFRRRWTLDIYEDSWTLHLESGRIDAWVQWQGNRFGNTACYYSYGSLLHLNKGGGSENRDQDWVGSYVRWKSFRPPIRKDKKPHRRGAEKDNK